MFATSQRNSSRLSRGTKDRSSNQRSGSINSHPELNRRTLTKAAKSTVVQAEEEELIQELHGLPQQSEMSRQFQGNAAGLWAKCIGQLPPEPMKFALNYALETLPNNTNIQKWGLKNSTICPLRSSNGQSL